MPQTLDLRAWPLPLALFCPQFLVFLVRIAQRFGRVESTANRTAQPVDSWSMDCQRGSAQGNQQPRCPSHRWFPEVVLGKVAVEIRRALRGHRDGQPSAIHFAHAATSYEQEYRAVLALPVEFDRGHDALVFPARALEAPLVTADPVLHDILRRQANQMLHTHPRRTTFLERVRGAALDDLATNAADQACVAQCLGVSAATLRRRLEQRHGTRYSDLVDELKREVATRHLQERELRINEIARRAGFTQTAPFYRAFQRWYGCTPNEYRSLRGWLR